VCRILPFWGHKWARCKNIECVGCFLCDGGLALCETCGGLEASLPTHCPGRVMTENEADAVFSGLLDYRQPIGWVWRPSIHHEEGYAK